VATHDIAVLEDFELEEFEADGTSRRVFRKGSGPAVIVIHEIPGITPLVAAFGRKVAGAGMTAVLPELFGTAGRTPDNGYIRNEVLKACVSREFSTWALGRTSPITSWLRALAAAEHLRCGGEGVGAVGMCLTGGFALGMMVDEVVVAPVLSQPSLPIPVGSRRARALGISGEDLERVRARVTEGACVIGLRFTGDKMVPASRFAHLREALGEGFIGVEIDSSAGNPWGYAASAHSVLTEDYSDAEGSPTRLALEQVLEFFAQRTGAAAAPSA
jgi:dienelactone hydrolase